MNDQHKQKAKRNIKQTNINLGFLAPNVTSESLDKY